MALNPIASATVEAPVEPAAQAPPVVARVGDKTFVANVSYSAGEYVAQDPTTFGAEGTGPDPESAEQAFQNRVDFLA